MLSCVNLKTSADGYILWETFSRVLDFHITTTIFFYWYITHRPSGYWILDPALYFTFYKERSHLSLISLACYFNHAEQDQQLEKQFIFIDIWYIIQHIYAASITV